MTDQQIASRLEADLFWLHAPDVYDFRGRELIMTSPNTGCARLRLVTRGSALLRAAKSIAALSKKGAPHMAITVSPGQAEGYGNVLSPFAMDDHAFRDLGHRLVDTLGAYLEALPDNPVYQPLPDEVRQQIEGMQLPAQGINPDEILEFFTQNVLPYGRGQNHPCFAAFVDPAASKLSMLAAFASAATNTSGAGGEYAAIYLEQLAVSWLMELVGFPREGSDGVLLSGGSDANRHCMEVARHWGAQVNGWDIREEGLQGHPRLTMYMSTEGHSCLEKAAFTLGLGGPRKVAVDGDFRMDLADLRAAVEADRRAGHRPFLVAANAGSVKTGAIDPLDDLADFCQQESLWLHVDGAYGGFAALDSRLAELYAGMGRADSVAIDPHKWMAVAIGCSCAMVRRGELLQETYKLVPSYLSMTPGKGFAGHIWYSHRSAEQTRDSGRALKTFWNIQQAGRAGLESHVMRHIDLARHMEEIIKASPDMELMATGPLTAVCFRYVPADCPGNEQSLDLLNQAIMEDVQLGGRAFLAGTDIGGRFALRACALHYALNEGHVEAIVEAVRDAGSLRISGGMPFPKVTLPEGAGRPALD
jgi:glutamate/tyrosine decarboxylase-like PLP-dependent enzyme